MKKRITVTIGWIDFEFEDIEAAEIFMDKAKETCQEKVGIRLEVVYVEEDD